MHRTALLRSLGLALLLHAHAATPGRAGDLPVVAGVEFQPLSAQVRRVAEALELLGEPLPDAARARLDAATRAGDPAAGVGAIQEALDPLCLIEVVINPESRVKAARGPAEAAARAGRLAGLPRQGPERGGRHRRTQGREPERRPALQAVDREPRARGQRPRLGGPRPLAGPDHGRRPAAEQGALGPRPGIPGDPALRPRRRASGRPGSPSTSARGPRTSGSAATSTSSSNANPRPRSRSTCSTSTAGRRPRRS